MNIHEHQARQLLSDHGISVKPGYLSCPATEGPRAVDKAADKKGSGYI